jgi:hypothetical protein
VRSEQTKISNQLKINYTSLKRPLFSLQFFKNKIMLQLTQLLFELRELHKRASNEISWWSYKILLCHFAKFMSQLLLEGDLCSLLHSIRHNWIYKLQFLQWLPVKEISRQTFIKIFLHSTAMSKIELYNFLYYKIYKRQLLDLIWP